MKLSKRGEYALRSLIALGVAQELGRELVRLGELAKAEAIPENFLQQILIELRTAGLVESERGKFGGFRLGRPAADIVIGDVVRLVDGPLAPIRCASLTAYERCSCPDEDSCGLRLLMKNVRNAISAILDKFTLAELVATTVYHLRARGADAEGYLSGVVGKLPARLPYPFREEFLDGTGI